jgi:heat shock protein HtpX
MLKRIFIFFAVSMLVSITISTIMSALGIGHYISATGLNYGALMIFCLFWGIGGSFITLLISKPLAKWTMGVEIIEGNSHRNLVQRVHHFARQAGLTTMPEVGIYQSEELNAFATGRSKNSSLVAVSTGLMNRMSDDELDGVLAHEVAHIANGDMVTMTLVQGVINAFVMFLSRIIAFAISSALRKDSEDEAPANPWINSLIVIFLDIVIGILAMPIVAWFSRYREYRADLGGANLAGKNKMIAALESLQRAYPQMAMNQSDANPNFQAMQISSKSAWMKWFSTHPPLEERIAALKMPH